MAKESKKNQPRVDVEKFLRPSTEEIKGALGSLLSGQPAAASDPSTTVMKIPPRPGLDLHIEGLRTRSQYGDTSLFGIDRDALVVVIDIAASPELVACGHRFRANFQVLNRATNEVERDFWSRELTFAWGTRFWVSLGNAHPVGQLTTPAWWALEKGLYGFRAVLEMETLALLSSSGEVLFRVR